VALSVLPTVLAVDLGAESGRVVAAGFDGSRVTLEVVHRFPNVPVEVGGVLYWDVLRLWGDIQEGLAAGQAHHPAAIGLDTWGVDFALLDAQGRLISNPVHYRDGGRRGMLAVAFEKVPREDIFETTGIQFTEINGLYQLVSMVATNSPQLEIAHTFLTMPDLFNYFLTGEKVCEFTNATTPQVYDPRAGAWAYDMLTKLDIPTFIFPDIVQPGTRLGRYQGVPVIAPACHDTGSAVAAVPAASSDFAYISSGTWSLLGVEIPAPIINAQALVANLTNEGGVDGTFRFLKNIMGLWIVQQCRAIFQSQGMDYGYETITTLAAEAPAFSALIDPDDQRFLPPGDMPARIAAFCCRTGQAPPEGVGPIVRCVMESLALKYRYFLDLVREISSAQVEVVHVVGGGSQNRLLCQMTANALQLPVAAGPVEATALGNALVQWIGLGELGSLEEARALVRDSFRPTVYKPQEIALWDEAYARFKTIVEQASPI
jgi:rhamnulokinase